MRKDIVMTVNGSELDLEMFELMREAAALGVEIRVLPQEEFEKYMGEVPRD